MGYWICNQHGKTLFVTSCKHISCCVENGSQLKDFVLVSHEVFLPDKCFINEIICEVCADNFGVGLLGVLIYNPQLREEADFVDPLDSVESKVFVHPFESIKNSLTSACTKCLQVVCPEFSAMLLSKQLNLREIAMVEGGNNNA